MKLIEHCDGVVLPGSNADVDPAKYDAPRHPKTDAADAKRDTVDNSFFMTPTTCVNQSWESATACKS
jgi:gamma-glutamyl-gamma-aminobutyrate hydrolase PuuD